LIPGIELLLRTYPNWETVDNIGKKLTVNLEVAQFLYGIGLIMVREASPKKVTADVNVKQSIKNKKKLGKEINGFKQNDHVEVDASKKKKKRRNRKNKN
jgi:hypothetical protein